MKINCQKIWDILIENPQLESPDFEVMVHLENCDECRKLYSEMQQIGELWKKNGVNLPKKDEIVAARQSAIRKIRMRKEKGILFQWVGNRGTWKLAFGVMMTVVVLVAGIYMGNMLRNIQPGTIETVTHAIPSKILKAMKSKSSGLPMDMQKAGLGLPQILAYMVKYDQNESHRLESVSELANLKDDKLAQDALMYALRNDPNPGIRMRAIKSLAMRPIRPALRDAYLYALWNDHNDGIRMEAIEALTPVAQDKDVMETLRFIASNDEHEGIRHFARNALESVQNG